MTVTATDLHAALNRLLIGLVRAVEASERGVFHPELDGPSAEVQAKELRAPCQVVDRKAKGYDVDASVTAEQLVNAAKLLNNYGLAMDTITGIDWLAAGQMEIVYDFFHPATALHVVLRTRVPRENPELPTISAVFPGANWHERETHEFFGIRFLGHSNLTPLLLPEDASYHPLRKDFAGAN
jgi:NADH-quinone oxidoreductase subunit C